MRRIVSRDNARVKQLRKLCQSGRERKKSGQIVLDGLHLVQSYAEQFGLPSELFVSERGLSNREILDFSSSWGGGDVLVLSDALFDELAMVETPSGIMAVVPWPVLGTVPDDCQDAVLLEGIQDPGNLGSILRTVAAVGVKQVLLSADCAQAWSPKALRAAMGAHFRLQIHERHDLAVFLGAYRGARIVTALELSDDLFGICLTEPVAWIFGNEGNGVSQELAALASARVRIPMADGTESLNVAAAAAVCLFECLRQRRAASIG